MARLPTPKLGGVVEGIRTAGRRVLYALEDVAGAVGGAATGIGDAVRESWMRLSLRARQTIALALTAAAAIALVWLVVIPNLPCAFPGGDRCPPPDDAAEMVPEDAFAYLHANLDPESEQYQAAQDLASRAPSFSAALLAQLPHPAGDGTLDFGREVAPWLGDELAAALVPGTRGRPELVYLFEVEDEGGAEDFASKSLEDGQVSTSEREGVEIQVDGGVATATVDSFLAVGSEAGVEGIVDAARGDGGSLAESSAAESISDELPDHNVVDAFVSEEGIQRYLADEPSFEFLDTFVNFDATSGTGAAIVASEDGLELALRSELDPERLETSPGFFEAFSPFEPTLADDLYPEALAYLGLGDPQRSVQELLDQAEAEAPELVSGFQDLSKELERSGRVSVESEILPILGGQAAFAIEPGARGEAEFEVPEEAGEIPEAEDVPPGAAPPEEFEPPADAGAAPGAIEPTGIPYLSFIASDVDEEEAEEALAKLQGPLADALEPGETGSQAPVIEESEIGGAEARSIRISPAVNLTFAAFDDKLVVATDPEGVRRLAAGEGGLGEADPFVRATEDFPDDPILLTYFNLAELIVLAEQEGLAEDPAYVAFADDVRQLAAAALAVERTDDALDTRVRINLRSSGDGD